ncbi:hypothetical protein GE09DRAFT_1173873 [Coniochaeta sp. 2T2.1]|nr:hypothetical protein GE09DRAFT_1173873 [Coniochaeta sp. 2T2.1]
MTPEFVLPCPEDVPGPIGIGSPKPAAPQFSLPAPPAEHVEVFPRFQVSMAEADSILQTYKEYHSVLFSFVPIPRMMSAYDLFLKKPFLFRTIMTVVAPQSTTIQKRATVWFREQIAEHMIVRQEKSLELLQALIISITWGEYHFYVAGQVTNLFQLAVALVMDLELNRPPRNAVFTSGSLVDEATRTSGMEGRRASHTLEDLRALLGCFYICSIYMSTACTLLVSAQEYESDRFLVAQIRMQRLVVRAVSALPNPEFEASAQADFHASMFMTMGCIRNEIESLKKDLAPEIQNHYLFSVIYTGALVRLYEPVTYTRSSLSSNGVTDGARRTQALWCCLDACRMFFDAFTSIPAADMGYLPFSGIFHLSFSFVTVSRLLFLNDSDWDLQMARKHVDLCAVVERLGGVYREADQHAAAQEWRKKRKYVDEGRSALAMSRDKMRWIRSWYLSKLVPVEEHQPLTSAKASRGAELPDTDMFEVDVFSPGQFDPSFWDALLNEDLEVGSGTHG